MRSVMCFLVPVGFLLSSCSDDDGGGGASEAIASRLRECELVSDGKVSPSVADVDIAECRAACQADATCEELSALVCNGRSSDRLQSCYADCLTKDCADGQGTYLIVQSCDGRAQCADQSDEQGCPEPSDAPEFCKENGDRITPLTRCNGVDDCGDGTDEQDCPEPEEPFTCPSTVPGIAVQISAERVCDLVPDCPNGADESEAEGCAQLTCNAN